jgi:anthranilate phosphoribosyltransferase
MLRDLLSGVDRSPRRDVLLLNAALALSTRHDDVTLGLRQAEEALDSGAALHKLDSLVAYTDQLTDD